MKHYTRRCIRYTLLAVTLCMSITSVYGVEGNPNRQMPIYIGRESTENLSSKLQSKEQQIVGAIGEYKKDNGVALIDELKTKTGDVYLSLYGANLEEQKQVKLIYDLLINHEEIRGLTDLRLHFTYTPLDKQDLLFKEMSYIKRLNIQVDQIEDEQLITYFTTQYGKQYELVITESLATYYGEDVSKGLDAIAKLYYDLPFEYEEIDGIFRQGDISLLPDKYSHFYKELEDRLQVKYEPVYTTKQIKSQGVPTTAPLQFLVRTKEPIAYIEYKVNDAPAGQSFRYPYPITIPSERLHQGTNEVKVIVKVKGQQDYEVNDFYIDYKGEVAYPKRATRQAEPYPITKQPIYKKPYIPTLMYHKFKDQVEPTKEDQSMSVSTQLFEAQLKALLEAGYTPINFKQLEDYLEGRGGLPNKPILITADDGYLCNYTKAYPILKKYKAQATFFVTSLYVGVTNEHEHFTWEQAKEMEASGLIDIQSHTHGHTLMDELNKNDVSYEVQKSFADIEKYLGERDVKVLAYPQFLHTNEVKKWVTACDVDLQVTNLVSKYRPVAMQPVDLKRMHVSNEMSPEQLIREVKKVTQ